MRQKQLITATLLILILITATSLIYLVIKKQKIQSLISSPINTNKSANQSDKNSNKTELNDVYWKNKTNVYYQYDHRISENYPPLKIEGADVESFQVLRSNYAKDKNNVYYEENKVDADSPTFQALDNFWAKDKNTAFYMGFPVDEVDLASLTIYNDYWAKDKNSVYCYGAKIEQIDLATFQTFSGSQFAKDKNFVYSGSEKLNMDSSTLKILNDKYLEDKNGVYYLKTMQDGFKLLNLVRADVNSFQALGDYFGKDKNNAYFEDRIINGADPVTFRKISEKDVSYKATDKNNLYECSDSDCSWGCDIINIKTNKKMGNSFGQNNCY